MYRSIADYGLIGDLHSAALVSKDGSVDYCSLPWLDSPTIFASLLDDEKGGFIIDGSALISCSTSRRITTQIDGVNYTMRGDLTKESEDKTWQLYFRDDDVEKFPIHNTKTKKLSADDLQNLRDALQEITKMEAKYGTKYLPQFINAEKLYNLAKKQFELENKK